MPTLALLLAGTDSPVADGRYLAVLDAMRGDFYTALVESKSGMIVAMSEERLAPRASIQALARQLDARIAGAAEQLDVRPHARGLARLDPSLVRDVSLATWEPVYGRLAEAQVKWETEHGRSLATG
jgi:tRNA threonylcarbamoyladenosine biosynthesis protein TsaB